MSETETPKWLVGAWEGDARGTATFLRWVENQITLGSMNAADVPEGLRLRVRSFVAEAKKLAEYMEGFADGRLPDPPRSGAEL